MSGSQLGAALWRRRRLLIAAILLSLGLGAGVFVLVGPTYQMQAEVLLLPPAKSLETNTNRNPNPYLQLGDAIPAVTVLAAAMGGGATGDVLKQKGLDATYTLTQDNYSPAPLMLIDAEAATPQKATQALRLLLAQVPVTLGTLQEGHKLASDNVITSTEVTQATHPTKVRRTQMRLTVVAFGVAAIMLVSLILVADLALLRRAGRRAERAERARSSAAVGHSASHAVSRAPKNSRRDRRAKDRVPIGDVGAVRSNAAVSPVDSEAADTDHDVLTVPSRP